MPVEGNSILHAQGGFEPQRRCNWLVQINGSGSIGLANSDFYLALKQFPFPQEVNDAKWIRWYNESRAYAGSLANFNALAMVVHDYLDRQTAQILYNWRRQVWNPNNLTIGLARNYKLTGMLYIAPPNAISISDIIARSRSIYLQGVWPTTLNLGQFDMDDEGTNVEIECTLSCDRAYPADSDGNGDASYMGPQDIDISGYPAG
jgi:hypothetical protein